MDFCVLKRIRFLLHTHHHHEMVFWVVKTMHLLQMSKKSLHKMEKRSGTLTLKKMPASPLH